MAESKDYASYAILIGVNWHPEIPLKGAVQDIEEVEEILQSSSNPPEIRALKAVSPADPNKLGPDGDPKTWPTRQNVADAFADVIERAQEGDYVYIQYSGHGTRRESDAEFTNAETGDLALCLVDVDEDGDIGMGLLRGHHFAISLNALVKKGVKLTVVLDCCFSGSVYRNDDSDDEEELDESGEPPATRYLPWQPNAKWWHSSGGDEEEAVEELVEEEEEEEEEEDDDEWDEPGESGTRDVSMAPNWLIDPKGYVMLAACGPQEPAKEVKVGGKSYGALSYYLRTLIKKNGMTKTHREIFNGLSIKFRQSTLKQRPILYGDRKLGFFGPPKPRSVAAEITVARLKSSETPLVLQAGRAHGVSVGDEFILHPTVPVKSLKPVVATVESVEALESNLNTNGLDSVLGSRSDWVAEPGTRGILKQHPVHLADDLPGRNELADLFTAKGLSVSDPKGSPAPHFHVTAKDSEYRILDASKQELLYIPYLPLDDTHAEDVVEVLEHLTKYEAIRNLVNPEEDSASLKDMIEINMTTRDGDTYSPGEEVRTEQVRGAKNVTINIRNLSPADLYIFIYDLSPNWAIQGISHGIYSVLPAYEEDEFSAEYSRRLKTSVPTDMIERGVYECLDTVKIIITTRPTSFNMFEMPPIAEPLREWKKDDRGRPNEEPDEKDWAVFNFPVRTVCPSEE